MAKKQGSRTPRGSNVSARVSVPGSERKLLPGAKIVGTVDPNQRIEITIQLRRRAGADLEQSVNQMAAQPLDARQYLTREQLAEKGGADSSDIAAIDAFAHQHNLTVSEVSVPRRTVKLSGSVSDLSSAFGVKLKRYQAGAVTYRGRTGSIYVPSDLAGIVERVLGLDDRPVVTPHYRIQSGTWGTGRKSQKLRRKNSRKLTASQSASPRSFTPPEVAKLYNFPGGVTGQGQTIALIELNDVDKNGTSTGVGYSKSDLDAFFAGLSLSTPNVTAVGVDGGANVPGPDPDGDGEVTLDIEVAGSIAPGASIAVYFGTNTTDGFIQALTTAIHDDVRKPSIISISWGGPEESSAQQLLTGIDQALQEATLLGVTVCAAAGDDGSADMQETAWDHQPHADFPASNPYALACGGTTLEATTGGIRETVWNDGPKGGATGGGVSNVFAKPAYQASINVPAPAKSTGGRGVPDVSGNADPDTGYEIVLDGKAAVIGGTSAVAPLWASLVALLNQQRANQAKQPVGFLNPLLYGTAASANAFHDVSTGNNDVYGDLQGKYPSGKGWDACTGLGTPDGTALSTAL